MFFLIVLLLASCRYALAADREPWISPKKTDVRSSCPMVCFVLRFGLLKNKNNTLLQLNALANHGYINRAGVNIALGDVIREMESDRVGYPSMLCFLHPMSMTPWLTFNANSNVDLSSFNGNILIEQESFNIAINLAYDHDASLVRQDYELVKHRRVDKQLVVRYTLETVCINPYCILQAQLMSFANNKDYLTYDDLAKARQLRYAQSKAENPNFRFGIISRIYAMMEAVALMEVCNISIVDHS
jgi:hypothetical protein